MGWHRVKKHIWEYDPNIWPIQRIKFMFALYQGMRKQLHIVMACDFETVDYFSEEIYRSSYILGQSGPLFGALLGTSALTTVTRVQSVKVLIKQTNSWQCWLLSHVSPTESFGFSSVVMTAKCV